MCLDWRLLGSELEVSKVWIVETTVLNYAQVLVQCRWSRLLPHSGISYLAGEALAALAVAELFWGQFCT